MLRMVDKQVDNTWQRLTLQELVVGDVFRMYEPDGQPVPGIWTAIETPIQHNGCWGIVAEEVELQ